MFKSSNLEIKISRLNNQSAVAEREGFEPPNPFRSTVFKTAAIDHSAIFPHFSYHEIGVISFFAVQN